MSTPHSLARPWLRAEIKVMTHALDSFVTTRSLHSSAEEIALALSRSRTEVVRMGVDGLRKVIAERGHTERAAAAHFRDHPEVYGAATAEMVARFSRLADEAGAADATAQVILDRIDALGLPPEVVAHAPFAARRTA